jgi:diguanylate cyclase (GGDEF)-like protein
MAQDDAINYRKMTTEVVMSAVAASRRQTRPGGASVLIMIYGEYIGSRYVVSLTPLTIGRDEECSLPLADTTVSRRHCRIERADGGTLMTDLESTNGCFVNGLRMTSALLHDGDQVRVGRTIFKHLSGDNIERTYHEEIERLISTDSLTGAFNRATFDKRLAEAVSQAARHGRPLSLLMLDIDHFKHVNDRMGHLFGDRVLAQLGSVLTASKRTSDVFCRYGGEEFAMILPETGLEEAVEVADRFRLAVARAQFEYDGRSHPVSVSIGVAQYEALSMLTPGLLVQAADEKLYLAKRNGRNRVEPPPAPAA